MPKVQRSGLPPKLLDHLLERVAQRAITWDDLQQLIIWLDGNPTVPDGPWFKRFPRFSICGKGPLVSTFLTSKQTAVGEEV
jgi:hypothetical protein